jgi:hypothetical protein
VLLDRPDCLVVYTAIDLSSVRDSDAEGETISVLWPDPRYGWRFATFWQLKRDLWQDDCDIMEREATP